MDFQICFPGAAHQSSGQVHEEAAEFFGEMRFMGLVEMGDQAKEIVRDQAKKSVSGIGRQWFAGEVLEIEASFRWLNESITGVSN